MRLSLTAALFLLSAPTVLSQMLSDQAWVQSPAGSAFGIAHSDLNLDTGELAVWSDYQGLAGDLQSVDVLDEFGTVLMELAFDGTREGFAHGRTFMKLSAAHGLAASNYSVRFATTAHPAGEMEGFFAFTDAVTEVRFLDGDQVVGSPGATNATASMNVTRYRDGRVIWSGQVVGVDVPFTAIELRGSAWFGENGPLILDLQPFNASHLANAFFIDVPAGTLSEAELRDIDDGFAYLLVRTAQFPNGAVRGQSVLPDHLGENYCPGRSNSMSTIGGRLRLSGSPRVAAGDLELRGQFFPTGTPVLPIVGSGTGHAFLPGGSAGTLCLGDAPVVRLVPNLTQGTGLSEFAVGIDLGTLPADAGLEVGEWLQFQCWYRDSAGGVATSNFSDAIRIRPR